MHTNLGGLDRTLRILIGLGLLAYALQIGFPPTGWNQLGWAGAVLVLTGVVGYCPVYALVEINTSSHRPRDRGDSPKG